MDPQAVDVSAMTTTNSDANCHFQLVQLHDVRIRVKLRFSEMQITFLISNTVCE
jgi:hypothetical protein